MSDLKLFDITNNHVTSIESRSMAIERSLQVLLEQHLEDFLGVHFLASEYSTGPTHGGRIDTLGLDENNCPVIIEYKRALNENVMNQGLFYLDWLLDHKAEFVLLVQNQVNQDASQNINWQGARLICLAGDFTRYDEHAVRQINRNIDLIRYRRYGENLLLLELVNATSGNTDSGHNTDMRRKSHEGTVEEKLSRANSDVKDRFESLKAFIIALGDDVQQKTLKNYFAFKRLKNFACMEIHPQTNKIVVFVKSDFEGVVYENGFIRDVREIGHFATGDLEITISNDEDIEKAKPYIIKSYEDN
jgi:predicted transport protein